MEICYFFHEIADISSLDSIISKDCKRATVTENYMASHLTNQLPDINFIGIIHYSQSSVFKSFHGFIYEMLLELLEKLNRLRLKNEFKDNIKLLLEEEDQDEDKQCFKESNHIDLTLDSPMKEKHSNTEYLLDIDESNEDLFYEVACSEDSQKEGSENLKIITEEWLKNTELYPAEEPYKEEKSTKNFKSKGSALMALEASYSSMDQDCKNSSRDPESSMDLIITPSKSPYYSFDKNPLKSYLDEVSAPWRQKKPDNDDVILLEEPALPKFDKSFKIPKKKTTEKSSDSLSLQSLMENISDIEYEDDGILEPLKKMDYIKEQQKAYRKIEENNSKRLLSSTVKDSSEFSSNLTRNSIPNSISGRLTKSCNNSYKNGGESSKHQFLGESSKSFSFRDDSDFGSDVTKFDLEKHKTAYNNSRSGAGGSVIQKIKNGVSNFFNLNSSKDTSTINKEKSVSEDDVSIVGVSFAGSKNNGCLRKRDLEAAYRSSSNSSNEDDDVKVVEPVRPKNRIFKTRATSSRPSKVKDNDVVEVIDVDKDTDNYSHSYEARERERDRNDLERWRSKEYRGRNSYRDHRERSRDRDDRDYKYRNNPLNKYYKRSRSPYDRDRRPRY